MGWGFRFFNDNGLKARWIIAETLEVETWIRVAALSIGGVLGVNARFWLGVAINSIRELSVPLGNIHHQCHRLVCDRRLHGRPGTLASPSPPVLIIVGFLGGYTTFSSYSMEALALWERGESRPLPCLFDRKRHRWFCGRCTGYRAGRGRLQPESTGTIFRSHPAVASFQAQPLPAQATGQPSSADPTDDRRPAHPAPVDRRVEGPERSS